VAGDTVRTAGASCTIVTHLSTATSIRVAYRKCSGDFSRLRRCSRRTLSDLGDSSHPSL
jgi:hypothetical protein